MPKTGFGIIGCGNAAVPVCEAIAGSQLAQLARVQDLSLSLARDLGERYRTPYTDRLELLLNDPAVEAVYIAVPHDQLAPLARAALEAGKHVLAEKPMGITLAEIDDLIALAKAKRRTLGVFYEYRWATSHVKARELVQAGAIGEIIGIQIHTLIDKPLSYWEAGLGGRSVSSWRSQKARAGGGVALMNSSHQLDALWYITGLEVASVSAEVATLTAAVEVEDLATASLRYNSGAIGSLFAGAHLKGATPGGERAEIYGTEGQIQLPDPYSGTSELNVWLRKPWNDIPGGQWHKIACPEAPVYAQAIDGFANAVQTGEPAPTSAQDARRVLAIILAIYQASAEGRRITLPVWR
jgi:predicted dehydrogenase